MLVSAQLGIISIARLFTMEILSLARQSLPETIRISFNSTSLINPEALAYCWAQVEINT